MNAQKVRSLVAYGLGPALGLATGPILARLLGAEGRGKLATLVQPTNVTAYVAALGVPLAATYFIARGHDRALTLRRCLVVVTVPAVVTYAAMLVYAVSLSHKTGIPFWAFAVLWLFIPLNAVLQTLRGAWQGVGNWRRLDYDRILGALGRSGGILVLALLGISSVIPLGAFALGGVLLGAVVLLGRLQEQTADADAEAPGYRRLASYSLAASMTSITLAAGTRVDQLILPGTASTATVGHYAVATTVAEVPLLVTGLAAREMLFAISSGRRIRSGLRDIGLYSLVTVVMLVAIVALADPVVPWVFGHDFQASVAATRVLCLGVLGFLGTNIGVSVIAGHGRPGWAALGPVTGVVALLAVYAITRGHLDSTQAAWAWSLTQVLAGTVSLVMTRFTHHQRRRMAS